MLPVIDFLWHEHFAGTYKNVQICLHILKTLVSYKMGNVLTTLRHILFKGIGLPDQFDTLFNKIGGK